MTEFPDSFTSLFDIYLSSSFFDSNGSWQRAGPYQLTVRLRPVAGGVTVEQWSRAEPAPCHVTEVTSVAGAWPGAIPLVTFTQPTTMREIVHIQAGQCGNQIGAKVSFFFLIILDVRRFFWNSNFFPCVMQRILNRNIKSSNVS